MRSRSLHSEYLILLIALASFNADAQLKHERNTKKIAQMYRETKADTNRVNVLLRWSTVFLDRPEKKQSDLDSAFLLASEARRQSKVLKFEKGEEDGTFLQGNYFIKTRNTHSRDSLMKIVNHRLSVRLLLQSATFYANEEGQGIIGSDSIMAKLVDATALMRNEKEFLLAVQCQLEIGEIHYRNVRMEEGTRTVMDAISYARSNNSIKAEDIALANPNYFLVTQAGQGLLDELLRFEKRLAAQYPLLTKEDEIMDIQITLSTVVATLHMYYLHVGKLTEGLEITLRTIKLFEENNRDLAVAQLPLVAGITFYNTGQYNLALKYLNQALSISQHKGDAMNTDLFKFAIRSYNALGRPEDGLEFLQKNARLENHNVYFQVPILASYGDSYFALNNNAEAEKYYLESLRLGKSVNRLYEAISYFPLGRLYIKTKQYHKAKYYLEGARTIAGTQMVPVWVQRDIQHFLFKADSATGDYLSAINHLNQFRVLNDSIFNVNRNRQIEELKIQFENDKKDADLKSKEQNIQLLTKQSELQQADLQQTRILRNSFIGGVIILFLLLALTYNRYRLKQKTNRLLEDKQDKINLANDSLQHANDQLHKLLNEKEWLVKEIHHRVKNNLQIVVSLLNTQANHLPESEALTAIRESQQRMQVISLLHQRLYRMEESRLVNMKVYIRELTGYISESYRSSQHVYLVIETEDIFLDISQAVSIGLILNEAITNSYKYAFNEKQNGLIKISLEATEQSCLTLRVSDNGNGLPREFSLTTKTSMGMRLIETLSDQLDGELTIDGKNGVVITIQFRPIMNEIKYERENINC